MENTLYDLAIGNIDGSKLSDISHFMVAGMVSRTQTKHSENAYKKLKLINEGKEAMKLA